MKNIRSYSGDLLFVPSLHAPFQLFRDLIFFNKKADNIDELIQKIGGDDMFPAKQPYDNSVSYKALMRRDSGCG